jgi:hypothetical protein
MCIICHPQNGADHPVVDISFANLVYIISFHSYMPSPHLLHDCFVKRNVDMLGVPEGICPTLGEHSLD